jgi:hypothetical protein
MSRNSWRHAWSLCRLSENDLLSYFAELQASQCAQLIKVTENPTSYEYWATPFETVLGKPDRILVRTFILVDGKVDEIRDA